MLGWTSVNRFYPYLKEKTKEQLPEDERKDIFRNIKAMLMHKIGEVAVNNTDNLLISGFVGVISAGVYSNYYLVIGSVRQVLDQALQGVTASVGRAVPLSMRSSRKSGTAPSNV